MQKVPPRRRLQVGRDDKPLPVWDDQSLGFHLVEPHDYMGESNHDATSSDAAVVSTDRVSGMAFAWELPET